MPIDGLEPRYRELGRLKYGDDLGDRPTQLKTWRITTTDATLAEAASRLWGGRVVYTETGGEVVTEAEAIEVLIPPQDVDAGQWFELWTAGGLQRRCTGSHLVEYDQGAGGWANSGPCACDLEGGSRACKPTTVLRVLLPQLPDLGVWRLTSRGVWAAAELPAAANVLLQMAGGNPAPAILALEERSKKRPGQPPHRFIVPVLRTVATLGELLTGASHPADNDQDNRIGPSGLAQAIEAASGDNYRGTTVLDDTGAPGRPYTLKELSDHLQKAVPATMAGLINHLQTLETLMIGAGLWSTDNGSPLDLAAEKWVGPGLNWRTGDVHFANLAAFADRAINAAIAEFAQHPKGGPE